MLSGVCCGLAVVTGYNGILSTNIAVTTVDFYTSTAKVKSARQVPLQVTDIRIELRSRHSALYNSRQLFPVTSQVRQLTAATDVEKFIKHLRPYSRCHHSAKQQHTINCIC